MTAQQLKNSILQMAVQGKLVPQNPDDEPASVLLQRIKAEKEELIKAGKIKKDKKSSKIFRGATHNLPYAYCEQVGKEIRDISDEIPFDIPDTWEWCRLGTITIVLGGKRIPAGRKLSIEKTDHIYIRVSDMKDNTVSLENLQYVPDDIFPSISRYIINKEDIYITVAGTIGRIGKIPPELDGANLTENADRLVFSIINQEWLIKCLQSSVVQSQIADATTKVGQPKLAIARIQNLFIPLPPIEEQNRIVSKIEELLPYIEKYGKAEEHLTALNTTFPEALKKSILQEAVQGKLVPQNLDDEPASVLLERIRAEKQALIKAGKIKKDKHESVVITRDKIPYEIPDSWVWCRLADICKSITDGDHQPPPQVPNGKPFIVISNVSGGYIDFSNTRYVPDEYYNSLDDNRKATFGDILFTVTGSYGIVMKVNTDKEFCFQRHIALLKPVFMDSEFLVHWLRTPLVFEQCKATATGTAQKTVGLTSLKNIIIPLPPLSEQKRIVAKIEELMQHCNKL